MKVSKHPVPEAQASSSLFKCSQVSFGKHRSRGGSPLVFFTTVRLEDYHLCHIRYSSVCRRKTIFGSGAGSIFAYQGDDVGDLCFLWRFLGPAMTFLDVGAREGSTHEGLGVFQPLSHPQPGRRSD